MSIDLMQSASLRDVASTSDLERICRAFGNLFGAGVRILDVEGRELAHYRMASDACRYLHAFPSMRERCEAERSNLEIDAPAGDRGWAVQVCHAGLAHAVSPVEYDDDRLGWVAVGPFRQAGLSTSFADSDLAPGVDRGRLEELVQATRQLSTEAMTRIMTSLLETLSVVLGLGHKVHATGLAHTLSVEESYRQLVEKHRQLEENQLQLEELDRLKSNLLATISHELRTPLTSIIGYSDMLAGGMGGGPLTDDQLKYVQTINEKGEGLLKVISTILDVASMESGRFELHPLPTPVTEIVDGAVERARRESPRKDVRLEVGELSRAVVDADAEMIQKAVYYLVDNAMKFSKPGGVVEVQVREIEQRPDGDEAVGYVVMAPKLNWVEIMVRDYGVGIPESQHDAIFDPLHQVDDSATRHHGGLGLGLALVKHYVTANRGTICLESREGEGSSFLVRLPREER
jgi:signal transduction histidine kinase